MDSVEITPELAQIILSLPTEPGVPDLCPRLAYVESEVIMEKGRQYPVCQQCPSDTFSKCRTVQLAHLGITLNP